MKGLSEKDIQKICDGSKSCAIGPHLNLLYIYCRIAERSCYKRWDNVAHSNWLEMGVLSITFFTRTTPDGQLAVEMYV